MSNEPFTGDEGPVEGPALRSDGVVEGKPSTDTQQPLSPPKPTPPIELDVRPSPRKSTAPMAYRPDVPSRRRWPWVMLGLVLVALGIVGTARWYTPARPIPFPSFWFPERVKELVPPAAAGPIVIIESTPPGATISFPGGKLGTTPWAGNSPFLTSTELTLTLHGYQPQRVTLAGASEAHLNVRLKRVSK